jgi:heterodisulfide reductase subunit B
LNKKITYYPGCIEINNLKDKKYDLRKVFEFIGINAEFLEEWNCCGAPPGYYNPSFFNKVVMPLRNLGLAQQKGSDLLYSGCSVCAKTINQALDTVNKNDMYKNQIDYSLAPFNAKLKTVDSSLTGVRHFIDIILDAEIKDVFLKKVSKNLQNNAILLYTGCYSGSENIEKLKNILEDLGAKVSIFSECCGGAKIQNVTPVNSKRIENANDLSNFFKSINLKADETESDYILTICSMCRQNIIDGIDISDLEIFAPVIGVEEFTGYLFGIEGFGAIISYNGNESAYEAVKI